MEPREPAQVTGAIAPRLLWVMAAAGVGAVLGIVVLLNWHDLADALRRHVLLQAEIAICAGALPGFLLSRSPRQTPDRRPFSFEHLYAGLGLVSPPGSGFTHYVPCALIARESQDQANRAPSPFELYRHLLPGVLYAGPAGVRFEPRAVKPSAVAQPGVGSVAGFDIGPVRMVSARPVVLTRHGIDRFMRRPHHAMLMQWPGGRALFAVPAIGDTLPRLHDCLDTLRWGKGLNYRD